VAEASGGLGCPVSLSLGAMDAPNTKGSVEAGPYSTGGHWDSRGESRRERGSERFPEFNGMGGIGTGRPSVVACPGFGTSS